MSRPVKKPLSQWRREILDTALRLFLEKGIQQTSVSDIMSAVGGAKGTFYHCFRSKEELIQALSAQLFFDNDPFKAVRCRRDLNALEKIRALLELNRRDPVRRAVYPQAAEILRDPQILAAALESNRKLLTPLWRELLEEGVRDGSIRTQYPRELSELLPLVNFWLMPQLFPATAQELGQKYRFLAEVLDKMGLPVLGPLTPEDARLLEDMAGKEGEG